MYKRTSGNKKVLLYVSVYEEIYNRILNNIYPVGSQLPAENTLAQELNVSRSTIRQALKFLRDDKIIEIIKGKGSYVLTKEKKKESFLNSFQNPIKLCLIQQPDSVEINYSIEPSTPHTKDILERDSGIVIFFHRWYKKNNEALAYSFSTMPGDILSNLSINLKNEDDVKNFLEHKIYETLDYSKVTLQLSDVGNISSNKYRLSENEQFYLIREAIYDDNHSTIMYSKYYLPVNNSIIQINTSKI